MTMGQMAVDAFFVTSGLLVTASLMNCSSLIEYAAARAVRIVPALLVMLFLTVFILGPLFTTLSTLEYFSSTAVYRYFLKCSSLFFGVAYTLPGVFENVPFKGAVNGSLWSLPYEVRMYLGMALAWLPFLRWWRRADPQRAFGILLGFSLLVLLALVILHRPGEGALLKLAYMYVAGATMYLFRDQVPLSPVAMVAAAPLLVIAAGIGSSAFYLTYVIIWPYFLVCLAYIPSGPIRRYNLLGDYSYGMYIYAFPVQQALISALPGLTPIPLIGLSFLLTMLCAVLSWHGLERKALAAKPLLLAHIAGRQATGRIT